MLVHPYLAAYRALIGDVATGLPMPHDELDRLFEAERSRRFPDEPPLRFVPSPKKTRRRRKESPIDAASSYDGAITLRREVPTRLDDLHDHCNFLVWLAFPRSKRALHARQFRAKERWIAPGSRVLPGARTREQDALTLFDEGGIVSVGSTDRFAFGHALLEHFVRSTSPVAATELRLESLGTIRPDTLDRAIARRIEDETAFLAPGLDGLLLLQPDGTVGSVARSG